MTPPTGQLQTTARMSPQAPAVARYTGEIVYINAFDIAYELLRQPLKSLLGQQVAQFAVDASKRSPRQVFFHRAQMVRLPPLERFGPFGPTRIERSVKVLPVGAISILVRVPFAVDRIADLVAFHDLRFSNGVYLYDDVRQLADEVRRELAPYCIRPNLQLAELEAYDAILDNAVERAYRDVAGRRFSRATGARTRRELREIRMDLARLSDELSNITKFFGDWHLARIYQGLSSRFHLGD